jgi:hypothetical protein
MPNAPIALVTSVIWTFGVIAVRRDGDGRQDADDRNYYHQLNQRETLLGL